MGIEKPSSSPELEAHYTEIKEELIAPDIEINRPSFTSPFMTTISANESFEQEANVQESNVQQLHHNDVVEADNNQVAKELELEPSDQRVSRGEVAKFVLPESQSNIQIVGNEPQGSESRDQAEMLLSYDFVDLRDVFKTQLVLRGVIDMSSQTDWKWKVMAERWGHGRILKTSSEWGAVDKTILKLGDRKKAANKQTVKKFESIHSIQETEIQLMALRKMRDIDKCVDTSDLDFDPDDYFRLMRLRNKQMTRRFTKRRSTVISHMETFGRVSDEESFLVEAPSEISTDD